MMQFKIERHCEAVEAMADVVRMWQADMPAASVPRVTYYPASSSDAPVAPADEAATEMPTTSGLPAAPAADTATERADAPAAPADEAAAARTAYIWLSG